jgi:ABC-type nickel/cobalt efflux system permease component RcnA
LSINRKLLVFTGLLFIAFLSTLSANPFLGSGEDSQTPAVRPPSSGGFMVEKQLEFKETIGNMLLAAQQNNDKTVVWSIMGMAFLYGILHAAGPGHRKTVIFSLFLSRKAKWPEPLAAAFLSAGIHAGSALALILIFQMIFNRIVSFQINEISLYMEGITYLILMILTLWFSIKSLLDLKKGYHSSENKGSQNGLYTTLILTSFFPCPGVIMIMTFSAALGLLSMGIYAVIALSLGMGITISLVGYMALMGRESLFIFFKQKENSLFRFSTILEFFSFNFLFLFSLWMVYPFLRSFLSNY